MGTTICLNMIVKDESDVIERCLESVKPFIDKWVIVDTGSTDGTQDKIRKFMSDIPGELHELPWKNFGANRNEALELARKDSDYVFFVDADEVFEPGPDFKFDNLHTDAVYMLHRAANISFSLYRTTLVRSNKPFRFVGVLHECVVCDEPHTMIKLDGPVKVYHPSSRKDGSRTFERDIAILKGALESEPDNSRYQFYLAQSYRDAGRLEESIEAYKKRAAMGGWAEEVWYSLYQVARISEYLNRDQSIVIDAYLRAYQYRPNRAEPLCHLACYLRLKCQYALAHMFANVAAHIQRPTDLLFIEDSIYDWRSLDECAISAYYVGRYSESLTMNEQILSKVPKHEINRIQSNISFSMQKLS